MNNGLLTIVNYELFLIHRLYLGRVVFGYDGSFDLQRVGQFALFQRKLPRHCMNSMSRRQNFLTYA